jgi:hypothetical protein
VSTLSYVWNFPGIDSSSIVNGVDKQVLKVNAFAMLPLQNKTPIISVNVGKRDTPD